MSHNKSVWNCPILDLQLISLSLVHYTLQEKSLLVTNKILVSEIIHSFQFIFVYYNLLELI